MLVDEPQAVELALAQPRDALAITSSGSPVLLMAIAGTICSLESPPPGVGQFMPESPLSYVS